MATSTLEAHSADRSGRKKSYEELYGAPAPKAEHGLTAKELRSELGKLAQELEEMEE